MGLWKSIFGFRAILRWDVLGAIVPGIFVAVGVGILTVDWFSHNLLISQLSFGAAWLLTVIKTISHAAEADDSTPIKVSFAAPVSIVATVLAFLVINVIEHHKANPANLLFFALYLKSSLVNHLFWIIVGFLACSLYRLDKATIN